jgi:hypothetical protein
MKGKYYGVYDMKREDECVGVFESTKELCDFFGGIRPNRVSCAIVRKNPLAFKAKRYWVEVFEAATEYSVRKLLRQKFGTKRYRISGEGIFVSPEGTKGWQFFAEDFDEAAELCQ